MSLRLTCWQGGGMEGLKMGIVGHGAHMEVVIYYIHLIISAMTFARLTKRQNIHLNPALQSRIKIWRRSFIIWNLCKGFIFLLLYIYIYINMISKIMIIVPIVIITGIYVLIAIIIFPYFYKWQPCKVS